MRNPHQSLLRLPGLVDFGNRLSKVVDEFIELHPSLLEIVNAIRSGKAKGFCQSLVSELRDSVAKRFGVDFDEGQGSPLSSRMFRVVAACSDDPDAHTLADWLEQGAAIGIRHPVVCNGVFPKVEGELHASESMSWLFTASGEETSHKSAEEDPITTKELLLEAERKGFAKIFKSRFELETYLRTKQLVFNPLGLISKQKSDGSWKHRLIWDLLRSRVNEVVSQGERIVLPLLANVVDDLLTLLRSEGP